MSSARYEPPDCVVVSSGVDALPDGAVVGGWDIEDFGAGRIVSLNRRRSLLALSAVPAFAVAPVSSDGAREDTEFARAGPPAEADSFAGRAGERRAVLSFGVFVTG